MSDNNLYNPDQAAVPWSEALRAQRDVGLHVPINFHIVPTVSLKQACFINNQYEHTAFQKCFSNLLAVGFRSFTVDVYWDPLRTQWSLCPVELPQPDTPDKTVDTAPAKFPPSMGKHVERGLAVQHRQNSPTMASQSADLSATASTKISLVSSSTRTTSAAAAVITRPISNSPPLIQIGSYNCTSLTTLGLLTGILDDFLGNTATTISAAMAMLTLNVHAASSFLDPDGPAPLLPQNQLPTSGALLSDLLKANLSDDTYTPALLRDQRENLNRSWYDVDWSYLPLQGYYNASMHVNGHLQTDDGWPTESFAEFQELRRVVASFGTLDPQMQNYNMGLDLDFIFPPGLLTRNIETAINRDGQVTSGCLFDASQLSLTSSTNSSWALSTPPSLNISAAPNNMIPIPDVANLTACGLIAYLNQSLANTTADNNPLPYAAYVNSTLWSWSPGQPPVMNSSTSNATSNRCVVMTTSPFAGRWRAADCTERHRVACHNPSQPYSWDVSSSDSDYAGASSVCRPPFQFSVPHTALENAHLLAALQLHRQTAPNDDTIFLDFNALNVPGCWVIGLNGTCPYLPSTDTNHTKIVIVPTVAAVIIFVLAVLTFFVKCAANRREDKKGRRRRMVGGWEYEGVPS